MKKYDVFFERIYNDYYSHIYSIIKSILFSKTDDDITSCVQEVFIIAYMKIETLYHHPNIMGWLVNTAQKYSRNFNRQYSQRKKFYNDSLDIEAMPDEKDLAQEIIEEISFEEYIKSDVVNKFLKKLSSDELKLYDLKYKQKLKNEEIGAIFGINAHAVASRNTRLINKFKKIIFGTGK
jgi:RNA polymerase sigma factor (sigma-70 family)